ncbi:MAG: HIT family protein [Epsilonproteobacteria bacterium]|nr:HIT family protein [Campylobacterota bacterium]
MTCPLCKRENENLLYEDSFLRVVLVDGSGYVRVILNNHVKELSDLGEEEYIKLMLFVRKIEEIMLKTLKPDKINIASLGNMVPHLHIHIIPRFTIDPWWPSATFCKEAEFKRDIDDFVKSIKELNG